MTDPFPREVDAPTDEEDGVIVPRELLVEVRGLVDAIKARNTIEAHRDEMITRWGEAMGGSYWARFLLVVMTSRALFGIDIPTLLEWGRSAKEFM
jgi:hypothetical protein